MRLTPLPGGRVYRLERPARRGRWLRTIKRLVRQPSSFSFVPRSIRAD